MDLDATSSTSKPIGGVGRGDSRRPFGPWHDPHKYVWTPDIAGEFEGGGYMVHFPMVANKISYKLAELKTDLFLDKKTRSIELIVTLFNANLKLFAVIEFNIHLNAAGLVYIYKIFFVLLKFWFLFFFFFLN